MSLEPRVCTVCGIRIDTDPTATPAEKRVGVHTWCIAESTQRTVVPIPAARYRPDDEPPEEPEAA